MIVNEVDILVVGAGPAGSSAAYHAAKAGFSVSILEKESFPRYKTCGGGLTLKSINAIPHDLSSVIEQQYSAIDVRFPSADKVYEISRHKPYLFMTMRSKLDEFLVKKAEEAGAKFLLNTLVTDLIQTEDHIEAATSSGAFRARFIIGADGANSVVARSLGLTDNRHLCPALEYEVVADDQSMKELTEITRFDFDLADGGYSWVFPKKHQLSIGVGSFIGRHNDLKAQVEVYFESLGIKQKIKSIDKHGFVIPIHPRKTLYKDRALLTGDAAGLADPFTAEGIANATLSGQMASEAIMESKFDPAKTGSLYHKKLKKEILRELRYSRLFAAIMYRNQTARNLFLKWKGHRFVDEMIEVISAKESSLKCIGKLVASLP